MTWRRLIIGASTAIAAVGCWWCVVRPVRQLREAGIALRAPGRPWRCVRSGSELGCVRQSKGEILPVESVIGSLWTLSLSQIQRAWSVGDSLEWARARDSIPRALAAWGGVPHTCEAMDAMLNAPPPPDVIQLQGAVPLRAWHLRDQDELIGAQHISAWSAHAEMWELSVEAFADRMPRCRPPRRRMMTVHEALAAIHRTIAEQIGF